MSHLSFDQQYQDSIKKIMDEGIEETNERTGHKTKMLPGITIQIKNTFPLLTLRKIPLKLFIAEQCWFILGEKNPDIFLSKYTKIWNDFTDKNGEITAAYGYRWRHHFGRDQLFAAIDLLKKEPSSRQAVIITWDPSDDGLGIAGTKKANVPCPFAFTINIMGDELNLHNIIRSNDMILGNPHDVAGFSLLQHIIAAHLGLKVGTYTVSISHAHIYDIHYNTAKELIKRTSIKADNTLTLPKNTLERILKKDDKIVDNISDIIKKTYYPKPPIKGLKIVL